MVTKNDVVRIKMIESSGKYLSLWGGPVGLKGVKPHEISPGSEVSGSVGGIRVPKGLDIGPRFLFL